MVAPYLLDTGAWIEYFKGSGAGARVRRLVEDPESALLAPDCVLAELRAWALRAGREFEPLHEVVRRNATIEPVDLRQWLEAAAIRHEMRTRRAQKEFGMIDALLVARQRSRNAKLVTVDPHFKGLRDVVYLGE